MARRARISALLFLILQASAGASDTLKGQMIAPEQAAVWRAVGPLNIAGNRTCTATLISDHEAITAAHCLFHVVTLHRAHPEDIHFVIGQNRNGYAALRGVKATAILPGYVPSGRYVELEQVRLDIALLELDAPVAPKDVQPIGVAVWPEAPPGIGRVDIVGYGRDRPYMPSIRPDCPVYMGQGVAEVACQTVPGLSGAPVTLSGDAVPRVVGVLSSIVGTLVRPEAGLVVPVAPHLDALRALLTP